MRILITNHRLAERTGTEIFTGELAQELRARGHEIAVLTWEVGAAAQALEAAGVPVSMEVANLPWAPELIHGQHHLTVMAALTAFPGVPALYHCHGYAPWEEQPPRHPRLRAYAGTAPRMSPWLAKLTGAPPDRIFVVENGVNLARFQERAIPLPASPQRALLFDNYAREGKELEILRSACVAQGMTLDVVGRESGRLVAEPEMLLPDYDIVFAVGRSALEALASGCAVIILNSSGLGGWVTSGNLDRWRIVNFTVPYGASALGGDHLRSCLADYDPASASAATQRVREELNLKRTVDRLETIYAMIQAEAPIPDDLTAERAALASYLAGLGPYVCEKDARFLRLRRDRDRAKRALAEYRRRKASAPPSGKPGWWERWRGRPG